jgi:hypothetical protein
MQREAGLVSGYGVVFWSGFSGGLRLEGNDGGGRRGRRSHYERRKVVSSAVANGWRKGMRERNLLGVSL